LLELQLLLDLLLFLNNPVTAQLLLELLLNLKGSISTSFESSYHSLVDLLIVLLLQMVEVDLLMVSILMLHYRVELVLV
jgi:hypothetical protein